MSPGQRWRSYPRPGLPRLKPGSRIAIGVGSRGISNIATIVRSAVQYWKNSGMRPFIFPAMGSHGAATAEGQADVLAHYGIIEETMGCPVESSLEVVSLGQTPRRHRKLHGPERAFEADGVMLVGRVKWHTDFSGKIESGLFKMMAIGLGKFHGAKTYHTYAYRLGLENVITQCRTASAWNREDCRRACDFGRCLSQHGSVDRRPGRVDGTAGRRAFGPGQILDGEDSVRRAHPDAGPNRQADQWRGPRHEESPTGAFTAKRTPGRILPSSTASICAICIRIVTATQSGWGWRM